jgi:hypothetical protein
MKNLKNILLVSILLLISGSLTITPVVTKYYNGYSIYIILITLILSILLIFLFDLSNIKIKTLLKPKYLRFLFIVYISISIIYIVSVLGTFINNISYTVTPMSIFIGVIMIICIILSVNKRLININLFFVLNLFSIVILLFFTIFFPKSKLNLDFNLSNNNIFFLSNYLMLFVDLIIYKLYFTTKSFKSTNVGYILGIIISFLLLTYFAYIDLTLSAVNYTNTYFSNILKFLLVVPSEIIYFDYLYLGIIIITLLFKLIIFEDTLRVLLLKKKSSIVNILIFTILFFTANTIINLVPQDELFISTICLILSYISILIIFIFGGVKIVTRIYQQIKK